MMLFVVCKHCKKSTEDVKILDICRFVKWRCPSCGEPNDPVGRNITEELDIFEECNEPVIATEIILEVTEIDPKNMEGSII